MQLEAVAASRMREYRLGKPGGISARRSQVIADENRHSCLWVCRLNAASMSVLRLEADRF